jgi:hypothetical protein
MAKKKEINAKVIAFNETRYYVIDPKDAPYIEKIMGVYLFDANSHTYVAELQASYFLIYVHSAVWFTQKGDELDDYERDRILQKYEMEPGEDTYMHVTDVDRLMRNHPDQVEDLGTAKFTDDEDYAVKLEEFYEDLQGNSPFY